MKSYCAATVGDSIRSRFTSYTVSNGCHTVTFHYLFYLCFSTYTLHYIYNIYIYIT